MCRFSLAVLTAKSWSWIFLVRRDWLKLLVSTEGLLHEGLEFRLIAELCKGSRSKQGSTLISSGYTHRSDPAALEVGPTGLAYDAVRDTGEPKMV
jgi:hypothetical protein